MSENEDFSWGSGKIKNLSTLGNITSIPAHEEPDTEMAQGMILKEGEHGYIVIDEFKEKMADILSKELHRKK
ncbi:hypothetical protein [Methanolobus sp. WCC5]|uniref:hypothetical protein n=1 Tax=Methanolobus sp. WCC5 TaxID=3125785 RepID=UPI00325477BB